MSEQINFLNKLIRRIIIVHLIKNIFEMGKGAKRGAGCGETGEVRCRVRELPRDTVV